MKKLLSFLANIPEFIFVNRVEFQIYNRMFPHLTGERDYGFPFRNDSELIAMTPPADDHPRLQKIEANIDRMPRGYGLAFRYIMRSDRNRTKRIEYYEALALANVRHEACDPRFIATKA